jgi:hypothetical protein
MMQIICAGRRAIAASPRKRPFYLLAVADFVGRGVWCGDKRIFFNYLSGVYGFHQETDIKSLTFYATIML